ncbi:vacuolar protein sorting-associated protein 51 homolog, partial [Egretta garzetta]|uniref:vacuolar protein sorting-associated protein 51 homolog n=1 Tax=Egretta garzetta TaxID=188379 RepID=UPI00163C7FE0
VRSECPLGQLLAREAALGREIRALDSDMQTLLYENYNKFISATDTIRKMKVDFRRMEAEMDDLAANMAAISTSSARVSAALQDRHRRGAQLAGMGPWGDPRGLDLGAWGQALRCHARARAVLRHYRHLPSFRAIEDESHAIMADLAQRLRARLRDDTLDPKELTECVEMLLQLEEPPEELCEEFLSHAGARLEAELAALEAELPPLATPSSVLGQLKAVLAYVQLFTAKDVAFASLPYFKGEFCVEAVREGLVVAFVRWLCRTARGFADGPAERGAPAAPPALLLLLTRLCLDYEATTISYILTLTDEQFPPQDTGPAVTPGPALCAEARGAAQRLLDHYVQVQGAAVAQMLSKGVETRDWLGTVEPRNVRAVMKRVVEDITAIDVQVGATPGAQRGWEGPDSSDSSRRAFSVYSSSRAPGRYAPSYTPSAPMDTHLLSNIQKLFSERIDIFSPVEFNKVSVLTGIIKISLKTLLECVRLRTLGRFGLQQVQVDGHYLQLYLWRFAADERVVQGLLDEVAASAAHRCLDPVPMEHSVVELICERG